MNLTSRSQLPELMDAAALDIADYNSCLADLASINRVTLTHRATLKFLQLATETLPPHAEISVLDLAFGQGDLLRAIARWARQRGLRATLAGVDLNPRSAAAAQAATARDDAISYFTADVFNYTPARPPDFIVTSQFTHHLADAEIVRLLKWMDQTAQCGWHIADLHRHILPFHGFPLLCRLMRWHRIVRYDGMISIARGFRRHDWASYLVQAGISAKITWHLPFRYGVRRLK